MPDRYEGPPQYADVPLTGEQGQYGVGQRDVPFVEELGVRGTEGLTPFPPTPTCPSERVPGRPDCIPSRYVEESGLQIFSVWNGLDANGNVRPESPPFNTYQFLKSPPIPHDGSQLWTIDVWAYEVARRRTAIEGAAPPLSESVILGTGGAEAAGLGNEMSRLKVRITAHGASGGTSRIIDIAEGIRFAIEACQVEVEVLYPIPGTVHTQERPDLELGVGGGLLLDTVVGGFIAETTSTPGAQLATNTQTVRVPATVANLAVFVPPGAVSVSIYQTGTGNTATLAWRLFRSQTDLGPSLGTIILGGNRRVERLKRPGNAGMITTGAADQNNDRILTFVWDLEI
jgi:hypothetical protein